MNILAFDTCYDACSVAVGRGLRTLTPSIAFACEFMTSGHAERLVPMVEAVMADAGLEFGSLDRIGVTIGPGTFTGTRISVSAARAFSLATGAPVVPLSSLNLMAMNFAVPAGRGREIVVATDARRGEVYLQTFDKHTLLPLAPAKVIAITEAAKFIASGPVVIAGSGAAQVAEVLRASGVDAQAIRPDLQPEAIDMLFAIAERQLAATVDPLYLRPPDAQPPSALRLSGAGA
jgi:tRNA threonylcarbamoyladenosine biosynthesis protein TsaB